MKRTQTHKQVNITLMENGFVVDKSEWSQGSGRGDRVMLTLGAYVETDLDAAAERAKALVKSWLEKEDK